MKFKYIIIISIINIIMIITFTMLRPVYCYFYDLVLSALFSTNFETQRSSTIPSSCIVHLDDN